MADVVYEKKGKIAHILLDRSNYNPINFEMAAELNEIWRDFHEDDGLWVAVIGSARKNFSAGFDIKAFKALLDKGDFSWQHSALFGDKRIGPDGYATAKPIVGAFNGVTNGASVWLVLQSDIRIATPDTVFGFGEGLINVPVEFAGFLPRYMPQSLINEMLFTGKMIKAQRFLDLGVINKIVAAEQLMKEAQETAEKICKLGPQSVRVMKKLVHQGFHSDAETLASASGSLIVPVVNSEDTKEGMTAFIEKRKPEWKLR